MPVNKQSLERYQILDKCFKDFNHKYTIDDLIREVIEHIGKSISLRTIRDDIEYMRDFIRPKGLKINKYQLQGKKVYYRYNDPNKSMFETELSQDEFDKLTQAIKALSKFRGLADYGWLDEALLNMELRFNMRPSNRHDEEVVSFQNNTLLSGIERLTQIIDYTISRTPLEIVYKPFGKPERTWIIHPWYVKQYNNRWFLLCLVDDDERMANLALDRIVNIKTANVKFKRNTKVNFKTYFNNIIGVTLPTDNDNVEKVVLKFDEKRFPYVVSKPLHKSQVVIDKKECKIEISVIINRELITQLLAFGNDIEVLQPIQLREEIMRKIEDSYKKYFSVQKDCIDNS